MWLRPGTLLDLTIIARSITSYTLAKELALSAGSISNYVLGSRNIKPGAIHDLAQRWASCIRPTIPEFSPAIPEGWTAEEYLKDAFHSAYDADDSLRSLVEEEPWLTGFACCTAQVLSPWSKSINFDEFNSNEARLLIETIVTKPQDNEMGLYLAMKYILWRIKTREGYYLEDSTETKTIETREIWPIPYIKREDSGNSLLRDLPYVPWLKKASTLDVLALCNFVSLGIANNQQDLPGILLDYPAFTCSCNLRDDKIEFLIQKPFSRR